MEDWFNLLDCGDSNQYRYWDKFESRIEYNLKNILSQCEEHKIKGTFFILGWIAERYPELVKLIHDQEHDIACHSDKHQLVYEMTEFEFCTDLENSKRHINDATGITPTIYRAPGFSIREDTKWAFQKLIDHGFKVDCSIFPTKRAHGGMPGYLINYPHRLYVSDEKFLTCLPINFAKFGPVELVFSGGGYFRLLPYQLIKFLMMRSEYNMTYFHPRDFDPAQPRLPELSHVRKFKSYVGLRGANLKLKRLLSDFDFISVSRYLKNLEDTKCIYLD